jgi:protein SCO1/2
VQRAIWAGLIIVLLIVVGTALLRSSKRSPSLPVLGSVPDFSLTERSGTIVTANELKGKPWVADFIFTRCGGVCPTLSARFAHLQGTVQLVSFSVDPANDTPAVLQEYAGRYHADAKSWLFLTGERTALDHLIMQGFRLSVEQREGATDANPNELITHSDRFVLVDSALQIRGYYRGTDDEGLERLAADLRWLDSNP